MNLITLVYIVSASLNRCRAASLNEASDNLMYEAIKSGSIEILERALNDYPRDMKEKPFILVDGETETKMSPLEMAIACHNPEKIQVILEAKKPVIDISTFEIIFKSSCVECFDILLDHSADLLDWNFNGDLLDRIEKYSSDNDHFFLFVAKLAKRLDFNNKLALIENAFSKCADHDQIIFAVDAVELDLIRSSNDMTFLKRGQHAIAYFSRFMVAKMDHVDLLPWANDFFEKYPPIDGYMGLLEEYTSLVKTLDDRDIIVAQPEDFLVKERNILKIELCNMRNGRKHEHVGVRVILKLISGDIEHLRADVRDHLPKYLRQRDESLKLSVQFKSIECLKLLLEYCDINSSAVKDAMRSAIYERSADLLNVFIEYGVEYDGLDLCRYAMAWGASDCLKILLKNGTVGPEHDQLLVNAIRNDADDSVKVLLECGINPNAVDNNDPVLKISVEKQSLICIRLLLAHGANPNISFHSGKSPLTSAVKSRKYEVTEVLLKAGANPNILDIQGETPLIIAVNLLLDSTKFMRLLLKYHANPNIADKSGSLPLIRVIELNNYIYDDVNLLLANNADPNLADSGGKTLLMAAIDKDSVKYLNLLIDRGANIYATTEQGCSLSKYAESKRAARCLKILLDKGINIDIDPKDKEMEQIR